MLHLMHYVRLDHQGVTQNVIVFLLRHRIIVVGEKMVELRVIP